MKVILNQDVINLGEEGDIREVAAGYARNYLFPKKLAYPYNSNTLVFLDSRREAIESRKEEKRKAALGLKEQLEELKLQFSMSAGENGKLFGSVTSALIAEELEKAGHSIERRRIEVPENHIRQIGEYSVRVKLYGQEEARVQVEVERAKEG
jgi:large subunit ribosomal protein L9